MFAVSTRATEQGAKMKLAERLDAERRNRERAERAAWDARMKLAAAQMQIAEEAAARSRQAAEARRQNGVAFQHSYAILERRTCKVFKLSRRELLSDRRNKEVTFARQFLMYWTARLTKLSLPQIGKRMGRDHTTILHGKTVYAAKRAKMGRTLRPAR